MHSDSNSCTWQVSLLKHHINVILFGESMPYNFPVLLRICQPKVVRPDQCRDKLDNLHHGDMAVDANTRAGVKLKTSINRELILCIRSGDTYRHVTPLHLPNFCLRTKPALGTQRFGILTVYHIIWHALPKG